jgi:hypothetical protein
VPASPRQALPRRIQRRVVSSTEYPCTTRMTATGPWCPGPGTARVRAGTNLNGGIGARKGGKPAAGVTGVMGPIGPDLALNSSRATLARDSDRKTVLKPEAVASADLNHIILM